MMGQDDALNLPPDPPTTIVHGNLATKIVSNLPPNGPKNENLNPFWDSQLGFWIRELLILHWVFGLWVLQRAQENYHQAVWRPYACQVGTDRRSSRFKTGRIPGKRSTQFDVLPEQAEQA